MSGKRNGRWDAGFTLIELMVVISIISVLAGVLVPNMVRARGLGQLSACESNLKTIGTAMIMYQNDNLGRYPMDVGLSPGSGTFAAISTRSELRPYLNLGITCPSSSGGYYYWITQGSGGPSGADCKCIVIWCTATPLLGGTAGHGGLGLPTGYPLFSLGFSTTGWGYRDGINERP